MKLARTLLLVFLGVAFATTAGFRPKVYKRSEYTTSGFKIVSVGDLHFGTLTGDGAFGMERAEKIRDWLNGQDSVALAIFTGDHAWGNNSANRDSLLSYARSVNVPSLWIVGNWEWDEADTGTGFIYNNFTDNFNYYTPYRSATKRGQRWGGFRVQHQGVPTNCLVVFAQNNRDTTAASRNYYVNNPKDGSGIDDDDFDGISDSTSAQRQDIQNFLRNNYVAGDWVILVWHRATKGICNLAIRPQSLEGWTSNADESLVRWIDGFVTGRFVVIEADQHQNTIFGPWMNHYTVATCMYARQADRTRMAALSSYVLAAAMRDTCYPTTGTIADSIGVDGQNQDLDGLAGWGYWNMVADMAVSGTTINTALWLFQSGTDATTPVFYTEFSQ